MSTYLPPMSTYLVEGQPPECDYLIEYSIEAPDLESAVEFARTNYLLKVTRIRDRRATPSLPRKAASLLFDFPSTLVFWARVFLVVTMLASPLIAFIGIAQVRHDFESTLYIGIAILCFALPLALLAALKILELLDHHNRITVVALDDLVKVV